MIRLFLISGCLGLLIGCDGGQETALPRPAELTRDAIGHYCGMVVTEHPGPKAQIFTAERDDPVWFPSVRDMFAYTMLPEEDQNIRVIYVSDTGAGSDYARPAAGAWVDARQAFYVLGSEVPGGMGLPETVPFADQDDARAFAARFGGEVVSFDEVTPAYVFADVETDTESASLGDRP